jgi:ribosomal protein L35
MAKQKTKQAARKRFHFSSTGKAQRRHNRQAHFNARATGAATRHKHIDRNVAAADFSLIKEVLPYK